MYGDRALHIIIRKSALITRVDQAGIEKFKNSSSPMFSVHYAKDIQKNSSMICQLSMNSMQTHGYYSISNVYFWYIDYNQFHYTKLYEIWKQNTQ